MNLLIVAPYIPMPDRGSEELRFISMLRILAERHRVTLFVWAKWGQPVEPDDQDRYERAITDLGIELRVGHLRRVLQERPYEAVMIEWFHSMDLFWRDIRTWQPRAKIIVDAVDVEYRRLALKAQVSGSAEDAVRAADGKRRELAAYAAADFIVTVSDEERTLLLAENPDLRIVPVPNIHAFEADLPPLADDPVMIFVGDYRVAPNVDAVCHFCDDILPAIHAKVPEARLLLVGNAPGPEIQRLASDRVTVTGYVPDTRPYLTSARVSVAPLRYGAGMKGKVGEAMSCGIPVVTTTVGNQGMEVIPGEEVLVADGADAFAAAVVRLLEDRPLCERLRRRAWERMKTRFGPDSARQRLDDLFSQVAALPRPLRSMGPLGRARHKSRHWLEQRLLWRLAQGRG